MLPGVPGAFPEPSGHGWSLSCLVFHVEYFVYYYFFQFEAFPAHCSEWNSAVDATHSKLDLPTLNALFHLLALFCI